jgi:autotransporter strand-loop-strand O-heptosyltransferase
MKDHSCVTEIVNGSAALGDCVAFVPMVQRYAELNKTKVNYYTSNADIFDKKKYDLINFFDSNPSLELKEPFIRLTYDPYNHHDVSLQESACRLLNIPYKEERPVLVEKSRSSIFSKKYVCISTQSTLQAKYWNNKNGWKTTIKYLNYLGYNVVCIDKHSNFGIPNHRNKIPKNCINKTGDFPLKTRIDDLYNCEFFIGLGSGLSWLAWACNKPVILISGFSKPYAEFTTPYRVINEKVCNGCWNSPSSLSTYHHSKWMWCPEKKSFECTRKISFEMVKENIDKLRSDHRL